MNPHRARPSLNRPLTGKLFSVLQKGCIVALALAAGVSGRVSGATTVGIMNPNPRALHIVDSPRNARHPNFVGQAEMSRLVTTAFQNNQGGVIDWENDNGWVANSPYMTSDLVTFGEAQRSLIGFSVNEGMTFGPRTGNGTVGTTSGTNYLGFEGLNTGGFQVTMSFSNGLTAWGATQLNRGVFQGLTLSFTLLDKTVIQFFDQTQDRWANNSGDLNWYGVQVSDLNPITKVNFYSTSLLRFDDMAFILSTTPIPEPGVGTLFAMGGLGLVTIRRRHV